MNDLIKIEIEVNIWNSTSHKAEMKIDDQVWNTASAIEQNEIVNDFLLDDVLKISYSSVESKGMVKIEIDLQVWSNPVHKAEMKIDADEWENSDHSAIVNQFVLTEMVTVAY